MIFTYNMLSTTYPPSMNKKEKSRKFMIRLWIIGGKVGQLCLIVCENLWIIHPLALASVIHNLFHRLSTSLSTNLYFPKCPLLFSLFLPHLLQSKIGLPIIKILLPTVFSLFAILNAVLTVTKIDLSSYFAREPLSIRVEIVGSSRVIFTLERDFAT